MNLYSIDVKICGTAYVKAASSGEAMEKVLKLTQRSVEFPSQDGDVPVSHLQYDDPDLPEISLSPALTIHGVWSEIEEKEATLDLAQLEIPQKEEA